MPRKPAPPPESNDADVTERRAALRGKESANPLQRLKGALGRPVTLAWRDGKPQLALVERRSGARLTRAEANVCAELRARLLAEGADETTKLLRPLVKVHERLSRRGWEGVGALPSALLAKAAMQADMLARDDPSPALAELVDTLRLLQAAAAAREQAQGQPNDDFDANAPARIEVKETSFQEFEEVERSWSHTMPSDLAPLSTQG
jgi:hypothetical protein